MAKSAYTYPELAAHIEAMFSKDNYGWGGLLYAIQKEAVKTVEEMLARKELVTKNNLIQLPPPPVKNKIKGGRNA